MEFNTRKGHTAKYVDSRYTPLHMYKGGEAVAKTSGKEEDIDKIINS